MAIAPIILLNEKLIVEKYLQGYKRHSLYLANPQSTKDIIDNVFNEYSEWYNRYNYDLDDYFCPTDSFPSTREKNCRDDGNWDNADSDFGTTSAKFSITESTNNTETMFTIAEIFKDMEFLVVILDYSSDKYGYDGRARIYTDRDQMNEYVMDIARHICVVSLKAERLDGLKKTNLDGIGGSTEHSVRETMIEISKTLPKNTKTYHIKGGGHHYRPLFVDDRILADNKVEAIVIFMDLICITMPGIDHYSNLSVASIDQVIDFFMSHYNKYCSKYTLYEPVINIRTHAKTW